MDKTDTADEQLTPTNNPSPAKRSLLKAAWLAPVIIAITLPRSGCGKH
jgi:hypothetical protein